MPTISSSVTTASLLRRSVLQCVLQCVCCSACVAVRVLQSVFCGACVAVSMAQVALSYNELGRDNGKSVAQVFVAVCVASCVAVCVAVRVLQSVLQCLCCSVLCDSVYVAVSMLQFLWRRSFSFALSRAREHVCVRTLSFSCAHLP